MPIFLFFNYFISLLKLIVILIKYRPVGVVIVRLPLNAILWTSKGGIEKSVYHCMYLQLISNLLEID